MTPSWVKLAIYLVSAAIVHAANQVSVPSKPPQGTSKIIDHGFAGIAMKSFSWPNYTSTFSQNLYDSISSRTGTDLIIRVGGTGMYVLHTYHLFVYY